ncbi:MAG: hybrid sensor histidine kinase/response regulator [Massilia sp.]|jgi:DNA-binding response OmpR family regulator|nr:hybrid sensor histidine kinase/response regulator [Massilia sp.]
MNQDTLILNVDDNDGALHAKTRLLMNAGFRVSEAVDGTAALEMIAREMPTLVLLDVKLPDIKGTDVCRQIKANPATSTVLVVQTSAALISPADKLRALDSGADGYLAAPFTPDELIAVVRGLLPPAPTND